MNELEGKTALVVGAGCVGEEIGNGRATAMAFAREGARVVCVDRDVAAAERTASMITAEGGTASAAYLDVTDERVIERVVGAVLAEHGRIDVLDNNVGVATVGGVADVDRGSWERVLEINLTGAYLTMKHVIPAMVAQGGGAVVNISSIAGIRWSGVPYASYSASKAALNHLTRTTAVEYAARRVRVNAVLPGLIKTPMVGGAPDLAEAYAGGDASAMWAKRERQVPMGRMGSPWEVAGAAVFLASDRASYVTGVELVVDGGITCGFAG